MAITFRVYENGSFSVKKPGLEIYDCFPGIDERAVRPVKVQTIETDDVHRIIYELQEGIITIIISEENGGILLRTELTQFSVLPHWVHTIYQGSVGGISGVYRQGIGFCGPSGYCDISKSQNTKTDIESYGLIALKGLEDYTCFFVEQHDKFINQYSIKYNNGEMDKCSFNLSFKTERVKSDKVELPTIYIYSSKNLDEGLQSAAKRTADFMNARKCFDPAYHWCSWYYQYYNFDKLTLDHYLKGFSDIYPAIPLKYIQIDAGYCLSCGDWLEANYRWPGGMKEAFAEISKHGYKPGIWIGPYMVGNRSNLYKEHPDWILYKEDGKPLVMWQFYGEEHVWGYKDEEYYVLDTSHPDALLYIRKVFSTLRQWGAELFKTDFMFWGLQDSTKVKRYTPGKTSVEYFRELLEAIREEIGEESYWLGCIAPFLPFIGYADGMRIAGDVGAQWNGIGFGPENMIQEVIGDNYFNHIYWQNDPDAILLRDFHTHLKPHEVEALTLFQALSGGMVYTSDPLQQISNERLELLRYIRPHYKVKPIIPFIEESGKIIVFVHKLPENGRYIIFFINVSQEDIWRMYLIKELTGEDMLFLRDWKSEETIDKSVAEISVKIPAHTCALYFGSASEVIDQKIKNIWVWE